MRCLLDPEVVLEYLHIILESLSHLIRPLYLVRQEDLHVPQHLQLRLVVLTARGHHGLLLLLGLLDGEI